MDIFRHYTTYFEARKEDRYSIQGCLDICKGNSTAYTTAAERMLTVIEQPKLVDTHHDPRLSRLFFNKVIRIYPAFREFYGMENTTGQVVSFFKYAAQDLGEREQIPYPLGSSGEGKSSLAEKLKSLMEQIPIYALKGSPIHESPLRLFSPEEDGRILKEDYGTPRRYLNSIASPWAVKRLHESSGDITRFRMVKLHLSVLLQIAISRAEPGDENSQDISPLVGKVDIHKLEDYPQDDPGAYSYSGGLCLANRRLLELVEVSKAPIKVLHLLLVAMQEGSCKGTEGFDAIPFNGVILAYSNEAEWQSFRSDRNSEAFLDRIYIIKIPYRLHVSDEVKIYDKLLRNSSPAATPYASNTLKVMTQLTVLTRIKESKNSNIFSKMHVYNDESLKDVDPKVKSYQEYRDFTGIDEGMAGLSMRPAFKMLSEVFSFGGTEVVTNPVHLLYVLGQQVECEQFPPETESKLMSYIKEYLTSPYVELVGKEIQTSYLELYSEYGQSIFDRYVVFISLQTQGQEYHDPNTGEVLDRSALNDELEKVEKPAGISSPRDFHSEIINFVLHARAKNGGKSPVRASYKKLHAVIGKRVFSAMEDLLPVISFNTKSSHDDKEKRRSLVNRMVERGYTQKQVRLLVEWYLRVRKSSQGGQERAGIPQRTSNRGQLHGHGH